VKIEAINHQSSVIEEAGKELGALLFNNYLSMKAKLSLGERQRSVYPTGFWNRKYSIVENDREVARIHGGFKPKIELIDQNKDEANKTYLIHRRGFQNWSYELKEKDTGRVLFELLPEWSTKKMAYSFTVANQQLQSEENLAELLLYCSYAHQVMRRHSSLG
jgi:hypothetical protein